MSPFFLRKKLQFFFPNTNFVTKNKNTTIILFQQFIVLNSDFITATGGDYNLTVSEKFLINCTKVANV